MTCCAWGEAVSYTPAQRDAFIAAIRERPRTLREIAADTGLTVDEAREILHRGYDAKRLRIEDSDRQNVTIHMIEAARD